MKKVISLFLVMVMMAAMFTVSFSASVSLSDEGTYSAKEAVAKYVEDTGEEVETQRVYFQMPNGKRGPVADDDVTINAPILDAEGVQKVDPDTGELLSETKTVVAAGEQAPSWYSEYGKFNGNYCAGIYWFGKAANCEDYGYGWCGYAMEVEDEEQGIFYADVPIGVPVVIFNNGVNGGMDSSQPIYYEAAQTPNTNVQGQEPGETDSLPDGTPVWDDDEYEGTNDGCIFIVNPNTVDINPLTNKQTCPGDWYVYYGNGCYGNYFEGCDDYVSPEENCVNPDHFVNGVHVGYHEDQPATEAPHVHTPGTPVRENEKPATCTAAGSYDEVVYCADGDGAELSRETKTIPMIAHTLTAVAEVPATVEAEGTKAHYKCSVCGKLFADATGATEVTAADLVIEKLPAPTEAPAFVPESNKLYFDTNGSGWTVGSNKIGFYICSITKGQFYDFGEKKLNGTAVKGQDGLWEYDPAKRGITLEEDDQYFIIFTCGSIETYSLLFDTTCLGHIAYADPDTFYENPVNSGLKSQAAFWKDLDPTVYGPRLQITSLGNVVGTCAEAGKTPESIFADFLVSDGAQSLTNAREYVVKVDTKTEQQLIDDIGTDLGLTKQQAYDAIAASGVDVDWDYVVSTLPGDVVVPTEAPIPTEAPATEAPHVHTPGTPVRENEKPATCTAAGSYDEVVYCADGDGAELSRETKTIPMIAHTLTAVAEVPATVEAEGTKAHYKCSVCGKLFSDATGAVEVTAADLVIEKLPAPTEAPATEAPTAAPTAAPTQAPTGLRGDTDNSGKVDIIDVTWIQRVLAKVPVSDEAGMRARGDVNGDGLDITDGTRIQRWLVRLDDGYGIGNAL